VEILVSPGIDLKSEGCGVPDIQQTQSRREDYERLDGLPMFQGLNEVHKKALFDCARVVHAQIGESLFHEGDPADHFFILIRGRVKVRKISAAGNEVILHLSTPPHMIGCKGLTLPGSTYPADGVAIEPVEALRFSRERFLRTVGDMPDVFFGLLVNLNRRLYEVFTLQATLREPIERRIAILILQQALPEDVPLEDWQGCPLREVRLTKSLIAAIVGTTTETAIRVLSRWKKAGYIDSERGRLRILKPEHIYALGNC
jgi:CRP/FNR family transcriptional regulator